jgi:O-antigen ligase
MAETIAADRLWGVGLNNWSYWVSNKYGPKLGYHFNPYKGTDREPSYKIRPDVKNIDDPQAAPAHNLAALTAGELGIPGLVLFLLLWARWFYLGFTFLLRRSTEAMKRIPVGIFFGCLGIFLQSLTEWVFRQSPIYYIFHIMMGMLATLVVARKLERRQAAARTVEDVEEVYLTPQPVGSNL